MFFVFTPVQYLLVGLSRGTYQWLFGVSARTAISTACTASRIPVYALLFIPARIAFSGDHKRFLERSAKIQAGLLICVYALSYAPALLNLRLTHVERRTVARHPLAPAECRAAVLLHPDRPAPGRPAVRLEPVVGRRVIAPAINATRTWEGFLGGVTSATLVGALLWWATPFHFWEAACMSMVVAVMGFARRHGHVGHQTRPGRGGLRHAGRRGTRGVLDRIDSLCFAAPVFYHLTRCFFSTVP